MVLVVIILVLTSIRSLQSWDIVENDRFNLLESWGITRIKRGGPEVQKIRKKFPDQDVKDDMSCNKLHKTDEAPFTAIILYKTSGRFLCMGSIVDYYHILSSKRCFEKTDVGDLRVLVGYYKPWWGRYSQIRHVRKIIRHEYEVALLRLKMKIKFTDYIQPVKLPSSVTKSEKEVNVVFPPPYHVIGFFVGRFDVPGDYLDKSKTYKVKEDSFKNFDECKLNYTKLVLDKSKLFCTLGNATYCWGGWGGPVMKQLPQYNVQIGIVIADNCTIDTTGPFLVARTDVFGDWIRGNSFRGHQPT